MLQMPDDKYWVFRTYLERSVDLIQLKSFSLTSGISSSSSCCANSSMRAASSLNLKITDDGLPINLWIQTVLTVSSCDIFNNLLDYDLQITIG